MYMQDERHSSSDLHSRHQQTAGPSYLQTHWQPMNKTKSRSTESDDAHTKPSQTENSWMQSHNKLKGQQISDLERGPSCSCHSERSKSADPPAVKIHKCLCHSKPQPSHSKPQPCGMHPQQTKYKAPDSTRTSITESGPSTGKSSVKTISKDLLKSCTCGSRRPPYWAGQSNLVSGPSYSKAMQSGTSKNTSYQSSRSQRSKPCRSQSLTNVQGAPTDVNQSVTTTWLSKLQSDAESAECSPLKSGQGCSDKQTETSIISFPISEATQHPCNQSSFGVNYETSATTRSRSIVGKVTCLCPSSEKFLKPCSVSNQSAPSKCTCATDFQDAEGTSHGICEACALDSTSSSEQDVSGATFKCTCPSNFHDAEGTSHGVSASIRHPSSFSQYIEVDTSHYNECDSEETQKKSSCVCFSPKKSVTKFSDCHSPSSRSPSPSVKTRLQRGYDPIQTSFHSHRSLCGGSCVCNVDEQDDKECQEDLPQNDKMCSCHTQEDKECQEDLASSYKMCSCHTQEDKECQEDLASSFKMCSCHTQYSGMKTPEDFCGSFVQPCATRKQRVLCLVEELSSPNSCDCNNARACKIQQLFRELTLLLRFESEGAVAPTDEEPCSDPLPFEECCSAQHERAGAPDREQPLSKKQQKRVECFHKLEEYLRKCFLPPEERRVPETDIYGFELNPDFSPDGVVEASSTTKNRSSVQFYDLGDGCSGDGVRIEPPSCTCSKDEEVFKDCEPEKDDEETGDGDGDTCTGYREISECDLCDELKTIAEKEQSDIECLEEVCHEEECPEKCCEESKEECREECPEECREECPEEFPEEFPEEYHEECPEECHEECPWECPEECQESCPEKVQQGCLCCHCRALICDEECKSVSKTLRSATCDPLCEMKYFIDSMIIDLHAMDCVLGTKQAKPQDIRANDASRNPRASFPVTISNVTSLGCSSLFVQWEVEDCRAVAGYEIYVDGHLTNRFYSFRHHAGVVTNVDVNNPHQIVLRAQAVGQEFPGEGSGRANQDGSCCQAVAAVHPEMAAGSERPWSPSVFYYDPNAPEGEIKC